MNEDTSNQFGVSPVRKQIHRMKRVKKLAFKIITLAVVAALDNPVMSYFVVDIRLVLGQVLLSSLPQQVLHNDMKWKRTKERGNESSD